jgi:hypothetical protein
MQVTVEGTPSDDMMERLRSSVSNTLQMSVDTEGFASRFMRRVRETPSLSVAMTDARARGASAIRDDYMREAAARVAQEMDNRALLSIAEGPIQGLGEVRIDDIPINTTPVGIPVPIAIDAASQPSVLVGIDLASAEERTVAWEYSASPSRFMLGVLRASGLPTDEDAFVEAITAETAYANEIVSVSRARMPGLDEENSDTDPTSLLEVVMERHFDIPPTGYELRAINSVTHMLRVRTRSLTFTLCIRNWAIETFADAVRRASNGVVYETCCGWCESVHSEFGPDSLHPDAGELWTIDIAYDVAG